MAEWISVKDRLPENRQVVLFHQKNGFIYCAQYTDFFDEEYWSIDGDCWSAKDVTHWMPLPEPPKKAGDTAS